MEILFNGNIGSQLDRYVEIKTQLHIIKKSQNAIKAYWNLPSDYKGEFPFNCTEFNTNQYYEAIKRAKAKLILLGVNPDG